MEFSDNKPIYLQLADQIMDELLANPGCCGERQLSVREFAAKVGVNPNTVMRTYAHLQDAGIIYNQRGIGYFFADDAYERVKAIRREQVLDKEIYQFIDKLIAADISPEQFSAIYKSRLAAISRLK